MFMLLARVCLCHLQAPVYSMYSVPTSIHLCALSSGLDLSFALLVLLVDSLCKIHLNFYFKSHLQTQVVNKSNKKDIRVFMKP